MHGTGGFHHSHQGFFNVFQVLVVFANRCRSHLYDEATGLCRVRGVIPSLYCRSGFQTRPCQRGDMHNRCTNERIGRRPSPQTLITLRLITIAALLPSRLGQGVQHGTAPGIPRSHTSLQYMAYGANGRR